MPTENRLAGNKQELLIGTTVVHTTKCTPKVAKEMADSSDTSDYDEATDLIHKSQIPHSIQTDLDVEGFWYKQATTGTLDMMMRKCYASESVAEGTVKLDKTADGTDGQLLSGRWDVTDFEAELVTNDIVSFKATLKSNGIITVGPPPPQN